MSTQTESNIMQILFASIHQYNLFTVRQCKITIYSFALTAPCLSVELHQEGLFVDAVDHDFIDYGIATVFQEEAHYVGNVFRHNHAVGCKIWA